MQELELKLGYTFKNPALLSEALTFSPAIPTCRKGI